MKCYPIIYTRTDCCDYYANFHVIPNFADANEIRPYILSATVGLDPTAKKNKKLIFANERYCVFGYIGFIKDLFEAEAEDIQQCSRDNKGRAVYGFFGFAMKNTISESIPLLRTTECFSAFKQYIVPIWKNTVPETVISSAVELEEIPRINTDIQPIFVHGHTCFFNNESNLFDMVLTEWLTNNASASYCSWINDFAQIKDCIFTHVVTTDNSISRLKTTHSTDYSDAVSKKTNEFPQKRTPLSAAEELQMMMQGVKTMEDHVSEPMDELSDIQPDIEEDQQIQSQNSSDYLSFYQPNEMPTQVYVKASKKKLLQRIIEFLKSLFTSKKI